MQSLPQPTAQSWWRLQALPDPALQQALQTSVTPLSQWQQWPLLLGLLLHSLALVGTDYDPVHACMTSCLDCLGLVASNLNAVLADAERQVCVGGGGASHC